MNKPTVVFDSVFFQFANSGIARVWQSLFQEWSDSDYFKQAIILDRQQSCPRFEGFIYEDFPAYNFDQTAEDSFLLESICQKYKADLFISTYYTTPISIPTLMMVYDMIPEKFNFNLDLRGWREKSLAILHANGFVCISQSTANDLLDFYPEIPSSSISVAYCGVDREIFYQRNSSEIDSFRKEFNISGDYYLFVGSRSQTKGYKNSQLFFNSLPKLDWTDFTIVCVGGEPDLQDYIKAVTSDINVHLLRLSDETLSIAYSGAVGLIYPSLYEGFGLPVIEAMACGCPVITTREGSIPEAAGNAAYTISGRDETEMAQAIVDLKNPTIRQKLIIKGLENASRFSWQDMSQKTYEAIYKLYELRDECRQPRIAHQWKQYRKVLKELQ